MMPISAADGRRRIVAHRKPRLREMPLFEIVRRTRTTHLRRNPAGIDGVAQDVGHRRAIANASAVRYNLLSEYA